MKKNSVVRIVVSVNGSDAKMGTKPFGEKTTDGEDKVRADNMVKWALDGFGEIAFVAIVNQNSATKDLRPQSPL